MAADKTLVAVTANSDISVIYLAYRDGSISQIKKAQGEQSFANTYFEPSKLFLNNRDEVAYSMNKNTFYFRYDQWINRDYGSYVESYEFTRVAIKDDTQTIEQDLLFINKDAPDLHFKNMLAFDDY